MVDRCQHHDQISRPQAMPEMRSCCCPVATDTARTWRRSQLNSSKLPVAT